jgi:hypothetical protein
VRVTLRDQDGNVLGKVEFTLTVDPPAAGAAVPNPGGAGGSAAAAAGPVFVAKISDNVYLVNANDTSKTLILRGNQTLQDLLKINFPGSTDFQMVDPQQLEQAARAEQRAWERERSKPDQKVYTDPFVGVGSIVGGGA